MNLLINLVINFPIKWFMVGEKAGKSQVSSFKFDQLTNYLAKIQFTTPSPTLPDKCDTKRI